MANPIVFLDVRATRGGGGSMTSIIYILREKGTIPQESSTDSIVNLT